jgi:hypothetical protein
MFTENCPVRAVMLHADRQANGHGEANRLRDVAKAPNGKASLHTMPWRRRGVDAPRSLNLGAKYGWAVDAKPRPLYYHKGPSLPTAQEAEWTTMPVWTNVEKRKYRVLTGVRFPNRYRRIFPLISHHHPYTTVCKCYPKTCLTNNTLGEWCILRLISFRLLLGLPNI